ncbi:ATP-binding protein [Kitasatospora sp. NPDC006697]|uniref:ATP-binding protein n=1 Tax=Kitasatospora sp. NPDC006697 TaxID=3364020 RepID=UPI0036B4346E
MSAAVHHHRHLTFTAEGGDSPVHVGRVFTRHALADWRLASSTTGDDAQLVASELLTNAVRHTAGPLAMDLDDDGSRLRITVTDPRPDITPPDPGSHQPAGIGGHGLFIVDRLALHWGAFPEGRGKAVWADLPVPGAGQATPVTVRPRSS